MINAGLSAQEDYEAKKLAFPRKCNHGRPVTCSAAQTPGCRWPCYAAVRDAAVTAFGGCVIPAL